jgi:predicted metalloprotease with PDZ domain
LFVRRTELMSRDDYLSVLSRNIRRLQDTPGRLVQSLDEASYDTWIKFYRPDENSRNSAVSYYLKGALVAWLLDAEIRAASGTHSLDDVMRTAYERFPQETGYTSEEFRALATEVAGTDLTEFFRRNVDGANDMDWNLALQQFGLRFRVPEEEEDPKGYLGVGVDASSGRLMVDHVPTGTPAREAGVNVGDELIAMDDRRLPHDLSERLALYRPGETVDLLVSRRGELRRIEVTLGTEPQDTWQLERDPNATPVQRRSFEAWIGPETAEE